MIDVLRTYIISLIPPPPLLLRGRSQQPWNSLRRRLPLMQGLSRTVEYFVLIIFRKISIYMNAFRPLVQWLTATHQNPVRRHNAQFQQSAQHRSKSRENGAAAEPESLVQVFAPTNHQYVKILHGDDWCSKRWNYSGRPRAKHDRTADRADMETINS